MCIIFIVKSYDAAVDIHIGQNDIWPRRFSRSVRSDHYVHLRFNHSTCNWSSDPTVLSTIGTIVSASAQIIFIATDSVYCDIRYRDKFVPVPNIYVAGKNVVLSLKVMKGQVITALIMFFINWI